MLECSYWCGEWCLWSFAYRSHENKHQFSLFEFAFHIPHHLFFFLPEEDSFILDTGSHVDQIGLEILPFMKNFKKLFSCTTHSNPRPSLPPLFPVFPTTPLLFPFRKKTHVSRDVNWTWQKQNVIKLGINSHIKAGWDSSVGGKRPYKQAKEPETPPSSLLGAQEKPQAK